MNLPALRRKRSCSPPESPPRLRRDAAASPRENPRALGFPATLVEFFAPSALELRRVHYTPVYLTEYVPPSGFYTLSTAYSSPERLALFHASNALGVLLSRDFPPQPGPAAHHHRITLLTFLLARKKHDYHLRVRRWYRQTSQPTAQAIHRLQGFAPVVNPYRGKTVTSEPNGRFPPELFCLSRVLPTLSGHVTRNVFTLALFPPDNPDTDEQARQHRRRETKCAPAP
jgi:hypothetical protein